MDIFLKRVSEIESATLGELYINNKLICYTLEDKIREKKIKKETAIPSGSYKVELTMSARFKTILPILIDVPNFIGIRIHAGNTIEDTSGCILVGTAIDGSKLLHSKVALGKLLNILKTAIKKGESIQIDIQNPVYEIEEKISEEIVTEETQTIIPVTETVLTPKPWILTQILNIIKWILNFIYKN